MWVHLRSRTAAVPSARRRGRSPSVRWSGSPPWRPLASSCFHELSGERGCRPATEIQKLSSFLRSAVVLIHTPRGSGEMLPLSVRWELEPDSRCGGPRVYRTLLWRFCHSFVRSHVRDHFVKYFRWRMTSNPVDPETNSGSSLNKAKQS